MSVDDLACYSDSLLSFNLIKGDTPHDHAYVVLIQNIKDILATNKFIVHHNLTEGNQSVDFMAKLGAALVLLLLLRSDASRVFFPRA